MLPEAQEAPSLIWQLSPYLSDDSRKKLMILLGNIDREPDMPKFRTLRTTNRSMTKLLGQPSVEPLLKLAWALKILKNYSKERCLIAVHSGYLLLNAPCQKPVSKLLSLPKDAWNLVWVFMVKPGLSKLIS